MQQIRQELGICLQQDCLFPLLTVREHIQFFSRIKGLYATSSYKEAEEHVDQAIRDVALFEKRNTTSSKLSGGMMRKLSVAIAFCGGSKIVFLDEPTSGMDPFRYVDVVLIPTMSHSTGLVTFAFCCFAVAVSRGM